MRIRLLLVVLVLTISWIAPARAEIDFGLGLEANGCPEGLEPLRCGRLLCQPPGSTCCDGIACAPHQVCMRCGSQPACRAQGSTCCGTTTCSAFQECRQCGTRQMCLPSGEPCPGMTSE